MTVVRGRLVSRNCQIGVFPKCASGGIALQAVLEEAGTAGKVFGEERKAEGDWGYM